MDKSLWLTFWATSHLVYIAAKHILVGYNSVADKTGSSFV